VQGIVLKFDEDGFEEYYEDFSECSHDRFKVDREAHNPLKVNLLENPHLENRTYFMQKIDEK